MNEHGAWSKLKAVPLGLVLLLAAACNGTTVLTVTSTPSSDTFLAYRVGLAAVQLQSSKGTLKVLPSEVSVDFAQLLDLSEVVSAPVANKGTYTSALITLDYSGAQIIYDDGSLTGVALSPVDAAGQAVGTISVTVNLDPANPLKIAPKQSALMAMNFNLAASNAVNLAAKTVTITPMFVLSSLPIDAKQVRVRGALLAVNATNLFFTTGVTPFDSLVSGFGALSMASSGTTTYEINGFVSAGSAGLTQLGGVPSRSWTVAYGVISQNNSLANASSSSVSFTASQVLAGSSVQGSGFDRVSGIVLARAGNAMSIGNATLTSNAGVSSFIQGATIVSVGPNTLITVTGQSTAQINGPAQISVGSEIDAFGTAAATGFGGLILDATAGRVRLDSTTASGIVVNQALGTVVLDLVSLGGRSVNAFNFLGSGANPGGYSAVAGVLNLTNSTVGGPLVITGLPSAFGTILPNFSATAVLDPTTIQAELVIDWGSGTAVPFVTFDNTGITLDTSNSSIGPRQQIQVGSQIVNITGLTADPLITPSTGSATVYAIGHAATSSIETFNTYADFIAKLQTELTGPTLATGMTAVGQYTASSFAFSATSITVYLNN
jgi:hypothetical protein